MIAGPWRVADRAPQFEKAKQRLQRLVAECPGLYAAHYNLACVESLAGNPMDALCTLEAAAGFRFLFSPFFILFFY